MIWWGQCQPPGARCLPSPPCESFFASLTALCLHVYPAYRLHAVCPTQLAWRLCSCISQLYLCIPILGAASPVCQRTLLTAATEHSAPRQQHSSVLAFLCTDSCTDTPLSCTDATHLHIKSAQIQLSCGAMQLLLWGASCLCTHAAVRFFGKLHSEDTS